MIQNYLEQNKKTFKSWLIDNEPGRVDLKILPYLKDIDNGFFVEAGALDGLFMSNTKILEDLGWTGLLIEPSHKAVIECRKNRKNLVEECALVSKDFKDNQVLGDFIFDGQSGTGAWSSITRGAYGYQTAGRFYAMKIAVPAKTLANIFKEYEIKKVDFLSLDVEGYELEVLKGIDFNEVDINFILVEINNLEYTLEDIEKILMGYKNLGCLSNFSKETNKDWDGSHQDYLFSKYE